MAQGSASGRRGVKATVVVVVTSTFLAGIGLAGVRPGRPAPIWPVTCEKAMCSAGTWLTVTPA